MLKHKMVAPLRGYAPSSGPPIDGVIEALELLVDQQAVTQLRTGRA